MAIIIPIIIRVLLCVLASFGSFAWVIRGGVNVVVVFTDGLGMV